MYTDFSDASGLTLVNDAAIVNGNTLRLTPAEGSMEGAAWYTADKPYVSVEWETTFDFNLNDNYGSPGGSDGFTFIVQNHAPTYLSGGGGTLGYYNLPNSLVIEFDTFQNSEVNDPSQSHVSIHTNGTAENSWSESLSLGAYNTAIILDDAQTHTARIGYTPGTLKVFLDDLVNPVITASVDLAETLDLDGGRAWVGFTATTGGGWQNHDILNWQFTSLADTTPVVVIDDVEQLEGDAGQTIFEFPVTVVRPDTSGTLTVQVDYTTADGTAFAPSDYLATSGTLTFYLADSQATASDLISVVVIGDEAVEDAETFSVTLSNSLGAAAAISRGDGTIITDDVTISIDDVTVVEGEEKGLFVDVFAPQPEITGALNNPRQFVMHNGFLYATSWESNEIIRYDAETGALVDVLVAAASGYLDGPRAIALGTNGNLYVANWKSNEILVFDADDGTYIDTIAADGRWSDAASLLFDDLNRLYVASWETDEVLRYDANGNFIDIPIPATCGIDGPSGLAFDDSGNLFVGSTITNSVFRYDGSSVAELVASGSGGLSNPWDVAIGPDGSLLVASVNTHEVLRYNASTGALLGVTVPAGCGGLQFPVNLLTTQDGKLFVASASNDSITQFTADTGAYVGTLVVSPVLQAPKGVAFGPNGDLYVANWFGTTVNRYRGQTGEFVETFVEPTADSYFQASDAKFGPDGSLYVNSNSENAILRYNGDTGEMDVFVSPGSGGLSTPWRFEFGSDGNLYVASVDTNQILRYAGATGDFMDVFVDSGVGGLRDPRGLTFGPDGHLYVISRANRVILRFDGSSGAFMDVFADVGDPIHPHYIAFDPDGDYLFVGSNSDHRVLRYDATTGEYVDDFVTAGDHGLYQPQGFAFDSNGWLYVAHDGFDGVYWRNEVLRYAPVLYAAFTVTLSNPAPTTITVNYVTSDGSAAAGSDYEANSGTLTFAPGETTKTVAVLTIDDGFPENTETFNLELLSANGATIVDNLGTATILDDETLFADSFEDGEWNGLWVEDSQNDWLTSAQRATDGSYSAEVDGRTANATITAIASDLTPYGSAELTFDWYIESGLDDGEYLALDLYDGSSWTLDVARLDGNIDAEDTWHSETITIDGAYLVDDFQFRFRATMNKSDEDANVDNVRLIATSPAGPPNQLPVADAGDPYLGSEDIAVSFDASASYDSDGSLVQYTWNFGDGTPPVSTDSATISHTFLWGATFDVTLTVEDDRGGTATDQTTAVITEANDAPVADPGGPYSATVGVPVTLDGSDSWDFDNDDGTVANDQPLSYTWDFGDGSEPVVTSEATISHTYASVDTYTVSLTVSDGTTSDTQTTTVDVTDQPVVSTMHVADLDGESGVVNKRKWAASVTITVLDDATDPVPNATVYGSWSNGISSVGITDATGTVTVLSGNVDISVSSVVFEVTSITHRSLAYDADDNTDPDGDSNGTTIVVYENGTTAPPTSLLATAGASTYLELSPLVQPEDSDPDSSVRLMVAEQPAEIVMLLVPASMSANRLDAPPARRTSLDEVVDEQSELLADDLLALMAEDQGI